LSSWFPKRKRWRLLGIYLALLALSHLWLWLVPPLAHPQPGQQSVVVYVSGEEGTVPVTMYFWDLAPPGKPNAPVLLLLHGSVVSAHGRDALIKSLAQDFRLVVPDLPGFGASAGLPLPDYSPKNYAEQLTGLLDSLNVPKAHVAAYGMGGAVALELADLYPQRMQSLILMDSVGTTEFEWFGEKGMNKAIYGAQLGLFNTAHALLPHFGFLDTGPFTLASARIYWDASQEHMRDMLNNYKGPMLIVHAQDDFVATLQSAQENYRLVPQSNLITFPGGHWAAQHQPDLIAPAIREFVGKVAQGQALTRDTADKTRVRAARRPVERTGPTSRTYEVMLLAILAVLTLFGEDATCIGAGLLIAQGVLGYWEVMGACLTAILAGNLMYYIVGWYCGAPALKHPLFSWAIKESDLQRMTALYRQRGTWIVFVSRFVPASRLPVFMSAGILRFSFWRMLGALIISNLLFTPLFIWTASLFGQEMLKLVEHYERAALLVLVVTVLLLLAALHIVQPLCTWRGRRLWRAAWRQMMRWQLWPAWQVQAPMLFDLWRLARKHHGFLVFTCANPGLPSGGFVGVPKSTYLRALDNSSASLPPWTVFPAAPSDSRSEAEERATDLEAWMDKQGLVWPIVLKRDVGGVGRGVFVCRRHSDARRFFRANLGAVLAQNYVFGPEFSIWFAREPGADSVRILAISEAQFPTVIGDGKRNLDRLILSDDRALCSARVFLAKHAARLADIPLPGAIVVLSEVAQRCDGAYALDATAELSTPELTAAVDALSRQVGEFHFGRFTVRCPDRADFRAGKNWRVLGAAGVKAAGSAIRDPRRTIREAHLQTRHQWEICFAIGAAHLAAGAPVPTWRDILRDTVKARLG
jgi:pimeloyl-ACP methyl ester carboxylesterase/membrane protein DedA with SNARE-associated domain